MALELHPFLYCDKQPTGHYGGMDVVIGSEVECVQMWFSTYYNVK